MLLRTIDQRMRACPTRYISYFQAVRDAAREPDARPPVARSEPARRWRSPTSTPESERSDETPAQQRYTDADSAPARHRWTRGAAGATSSITKDRGRDFMGARRRGRRSSQPNAAPGTGEQPQAQPEQPRGLVPQAVVAGEKLRIGSFERSRPTSRGCSKPAASRSRAKVTLPANGRPLRDQRSRPTWERSAGSHRVAVRL